MLGGPRHLCTPCKEKHLIKLKTINHNVVPYCEQIKDIPTQERCEMHPSKVYIKYCEVCQVPLCDSCLQYSNYGFHYSLCRKKRHNILSLKKHIEQSINNTEKPLAPSDTMLFFTDLFSYKESKLIMKLVTQNFHQSNMLGKSQTIKSNIDNVFRPVDFIYKYLKSNMSIIHKYMLIYEQSPSAVKFLLSIKKIKTKDVMGLLSDIQIKNGGYRSMREKKKC